MKYIKEYAWVIYLGAAIPAIAKINILTWQWWVIVMPIIVLVAWKDDKSKEE